MRDSQLIAICKQHETENLETRDFAQDLISFWDSIVVGKDNAPTITDYSVEGWPNRLGQLLQRNFGYRAGNITYFRQQKKAQDTFVVPSWFFLPLDKHIDNKQWQEVRSFFQEGVNDEIKLPYTESHRSLSFPRNSKFETEHDCAFFSDGEASYRCLQFLWKNYQSLIATKNSEFLVEWMIVLGILSWNKSPTVRLIRMLSWIRDDLARAGDELLEKYIAHAKSRLGHKHLDDTSIEILTPHSETPLTDDQLSEIERIVITYLETDSRIHPIGVNILGHLVLRCVSPPPDRYQVSLFGRIREYLSKIDVVLRDRTCTDRCILIMPVSVPVGTNLALPVYYFGSHIGLSPSITGYGELNRRLLSIYTLLSLCVTSISGKLLPSMMALEEREVYGRQIANMIAHDVAHSVYEALSFSESPATLISLSSESSRRVKQLVTNNIVQRRLLVGMFAGPWLERQQQHNQFVIKWAPQLATRADLEFWRVTIAYQAAAILYAAVYAIIKEVHLIPNTDQSDIEKCITELTRVKIKYSFISTLSSQPNAEIITADLDYLYGVVEKLRAQESAKTPWPLMADRASDLMTFEGQQAAILWPLREMLRNAVGYVLDCVKQSQILGVSPMVDLVAYIIPEQRSFRFRVSNNKNPGFDISAVMPRALAYFHSLMPGASIEDLSNDQQVIIESSLVCEESDKGG